MAHSWKSTAFAATFICALAVAKSSTATSGRVHRLQRSRNFTHKPLQVFSQPVHVAKDVNCRNFAVVTTINTPTKAVTQTCAVLKDWCLIVVADEKTPVDYTVPGPCTVKVLSVDEQKKMVNDGGNARADAAFINRMPWNHFGRKNVGYLYAIAHGADAVWDFDDDNELLVHRLTVHDGKSDTLPVTTLPNERGDVINPYPLLGQTLQSWPRGFPLERVVDSMATNYTLGHGVWNKSKVGVIQSLAQGNPDVDAIYRLTRPLPLEFDRDASTHLLIPRRTFAPFNAQATLFTQRSSLWATYLPVTVHGRVSDIWRSYIVQRLMWDVGMHVAFGGPWVRQDRNPHNLMADFDAELPLYMQTTSLIQLLTTWSPHHTSTLKQRIIDLYALLYEHKFIEHDDVVNVQHWLAALEAVGYAFPTIAPQAAIIVRTYNGGVDAMNKWLLPTVDMFVRRDVFEFVFVLDDENDKDHALGTCLESRGYKVVYEALPANHEIMFKGVSFSGTTYARSGYDRQQWSTFYLDKYTDADVIGVVDADAMFFSLVDVGDILTPDHKIWAKATPTSHYGNDAVALKNDAVKDFMWVDRMPMWMWRDTFSHVRNYVSHKWGQPFDDAFVYFTDAWFSQFNIMLNTAVTLQSNWYATVMPSDAPTRGVISVGCNRCREGDIAVGCCLVHDVGCTNANQDVLKSFDHVLRFNNVNVSWANSRELVDGHVLMIKNAKGSMPAKMRTACSDYVAGSWKGLCKPA